MVSRGSIRGRWCRALVVALTLGACSSREPAPPELLAMDPARGPVGVTRAVQIHGRFALGLHIDFVEGDGSWLRADFTARLGALPLESVRYGDGETLEARVPPIDAEGAYDLTVTDSYGREATLAQAYTVTSACADEIPGDGIDQDCDGVDACYEDLDGDGYGGSVLVTASPEGCGATSGATARTGDCDDSQAGCGAACNPGSPDLCDGIDNDCDATTADGADDPRVGLACDGADSDACEDDRQVCVAAAIGCSLGANDRETVADGTDQDCDGGDMCYVDNDGDHSGSRVQRADDDVDCDNGSSLTASNDDDCNDSDPLVFQGTACDDGDACTLYDACYGGGCRGVYACSDTAGVCSGDCKSCSSNPCCRDTCATGTCTTCAGGCSCGYDCSGSTGCAAVCAPDSVCGLYATTSNDGSITCTGAGCAMICAGAGRCEMDCTAGARCELECRDTRTCTLRCDADSHCSFVVCSSVNGKSVDCGGGIFVCNQPCPG